MPRLHPTIAVVAITVALSGLRAAPAQEAHEAKPKPVLAAVASELDAGEVVEGDEPHYKFTLMNHGDRPIKLRVVSFCGCTLSRYDPEIAPGGQGTVEATLNTAHMKGKVIKMIAVRAEEEAMGKVDLRVLATVRPLVNVSPSNAAFLVVKDHVPNRVEFTLTPEPGKGIQFTEVTSNSRFFLSRLVPPTDPDGPTRLIVSVTPDAPPGLLQANLAVTTSSPKVPRVGLVVTGEKGIAVSPRTVYWGGISETTGTAREEILLTKRGGRFAVRGVTCDDPAVRAAVETVADGSQYKVMVSYAGGWKAGRQRATLKINTDDPAQPEILVPVQALVSAASTTAAGGL
jgi:hypothetical protein